MELLRLRRQLILAQRGHKLLGDKLEQMMYRFLTIIKETEVLNRELNEKIKKLFLRLTVCRALTREEDFSSALKDTELKFEFRSQLVKIMNVYVPQFFCHTEQIKLNYDFYKISPELDLALAGLVTTLPLMLKLAQSLKTAELLSFEIERTRRRVNALEYLLIPAIQETIRFINDKLNELERAGFVRLMRVKEIVRSH